MVSEAKCNGARIIHGGRHLSDIGPLFFEPTIVTDIKTARVLLKEKIKREKF